MDLMRGEIVLTVRKDEVADQVMRVSGWRRGNDGQHQLTTRLLLFTLQPDPLLPLILLSVLLISSLCDTSSSQSGDDISDTLIS